MAVKPMRRKTELVVDLPKPTAVSAVPDPTRLLTASGAGVKVAYEEARSGDGRRIAGSDQK